MAMDKCDGQKKYKMFLINPSIICSEVPWLNMRVKIDPLLNDGKVFEPHVAVDNEYNASN